MVHDCIRKMYNSVVVMIGPAASDEENLRCFLPSPTESVGRVRQREHHPIDSQFEG